MFVTKLRTVWLIKFWLLSTEVYSSLLAKKGRLRVTDQSGRYSVIDNHVRVSFWPSFRILRGPDHFTALEYATRRRCTCHKQFRKVTCGFMYQRSNTSMAIESPTGKRFTGQRVVSKLQTANNKVSRILTSTRYHFANHRILCWIFSMLRGV